MSTTEDWTNWLLRFEVTRNNNNAFKFLYHIKGEETWTDFYLSISEIRDILYHKDFRPFYPDCSLLVQFTGRTFRIINLNDKAKETFIPFREEELFPFLEQVLLLKPTETLDMLQPYLDSLERAIPKVDETISDNAKEICELEGISFYLDRVRQIAKNSSKGQDDPVELFFMKDHGPKDLYWVIARNNNRIMNGGVIYDQSRETWGIHT